MEQIFVELIILLVLVWLFETKMIPQIIVLFLTLSIMIYEVDLSTDLQPQIGQIMLFAVIMLYSALQIYVSKKENT